MMAVVRLTVLRVSSASMAQHSPAQATAAPSLLALSGQCTSPSGRCPRSPARLPDRARSRRSLRQNAPARW